MRKVLMLLCFAMSLSAGCATFGQMEAGLNSLRGAGEEEVFSVLGYPDGKMELNNDTIVYVWNNRESGTHTVPRVENTRGTVGKVPYTAQRTTYVQEHYDYSCTIKYAFRNGRALNYEYSGDIDGCCPYIERLKKYSETRVMPESPYY